LAPIRFRPGKDGVTITDAGTFLAIYGFLKLETPLANIDEAHVTRNYRWWMAAGARRSLADIQAGGALKVPGLFGRWCEDFGVRHPSAVVALTDRGATRL
jgi:hypothetical protein